MRFKKYTYRVKCNQVSVNSWSLRRRSVTVIFFLFIYLFIIFLWASRLAAAWIPQQRRCRTPLRKRLVSLPAVTVAASHAISQCVFSQHSNVSIREETMQLYIYIYICTHILIYPCLWAITADTEIRSSGHQSSQIQRRTAPFTHCDLWDVLFSLIRHVSSGSTFKFSLGEAVPSVRMLQRASPGWELREWSPLCQRDVKCLAERYRSVWASAARPLPQWAQWGEAAVAQSFHRRAQWRRQPAVSITELSHIFLTSQWWNIWNVFIASVANNLVYNQPLCSVSVCHCHWGELMRVEGQYWLIDWIERVCSTINQKEWAKHTTFFSLGRHTEIIISFISKTKPV